MVMLDAFHLHSNSVVRVAMLVAFHLHQVCANRGVETLGAPVRSRAAVVVMLVASTQAISVQKIGHA